MDKPHIPKNPRVRIAPSPTGFLHIGTARTALFNFLFAKKHGGKFILRIEDTDKERSEKRFEEDITAGFKWLDFNWDEGPDIGGEFGPYRQSERKDRHNFFLIELVEENKAYYCFCTMEELEAHKNYLASQGLPIKYSGKCASLSKQEADSRIRGGEKNVIRFRTPEKKVVFFDLVKGKIEFDTELFGDIVIAKSLNEPLYNFAAAIDDEEMRIDYVIRGEDHLSNTPKQILVQEALGFKTPLYGHLPLILGPDKSKLSKRHGAASISEYRKDGYLTEAMVNFIAFLGWNPGDDREIFSLPELISEFNINKVSKSAAIFNTQKLNWLNGHYIRQKTNAELAQLCLPYFKEAGYVGEAVDLSLLEKIVAVEKDRLKKLSEVTAFSDFFFRLPEYSPDLLIWKKGSKENALACLKSIKDAVSGIEKEKFSGAALKSILDKLTEKFSTGEVYWPLRVALSGKEASPDPIEIADVLGKDEVLRRIEMAIKKLEAGSVGSERNHFSGENSGKIRDARSDVYQAIRERRATKKLARIRPPEGRP